MFLPKKWKRSRGNSVKIFQNASEELKCRLRNYVLTKDDLKKGQVIEFSYLPKKGTTTKVNYKEVGSVMKGFAFSELWRAYFDLNPAAQP